MSEIEQFITNPENIFVELEDKAMPRSPTKIALRLAELECKSTKKRKRDTPRGFLKLQVGEAHRQGNRDTMEDAHIVDAHYYDDYHKFDIVATKTRPFALFGVLDGHGGGFASRFMAQSLHHGIRERLMRRMHPVKAIGLAHMRAECDYFDMFPNKDDGSTAVLVMLETRNGRMWISNVGDSRAILCRNKRAFPLTKDQDAKNSKERARIKAANGDIDEDGYINDSVQPARALGDINSKYLVDEDGSLAYSLAVVANPEIRSVQLRDDDEFILLACDGLFEQKGNGYWISQARRYMKDGFTPEETAKKLVKMAIVGGSSDNVSCVIVKLS